MAPIIYLHGFASGPGSHKACLFRDRFAAVGIELAVPDLSQGDFEHLTITGQLGVVERLAGGAPVALIGSSLGGYLAALYAARHPEVTRAVLMAPAFGFPRRFRELIGPAAAAAWEHTGWLDTYHYGEKRNCQLSYDLMTDGARYEDEPAVSQPVLILHGARDEVVPVRLSEAFAANRSNVQLEVLDSDHELLDALETLWQKARAFLLVS